LNRSFIIAILLFASASLKAEYDGYRIKFLIEHVNGNISQGFVDFSAHNLNLDSLISPGYLKEIFVKYDGSLAGNFIYFKEKIKYEYENVNDSSGQVNFIYCLTEKTSLPFKSIKQIMAEEIEKFSYCIGIMIANELSSADTVWMKNKPLRKVQFTGYFHSYHIFLHEISPAINTVIKQLEAKQKEIDDIEIITDDSGFSENGHKADEELFKLIQKLYQSKVVVILEYDC